MNCVQEYLSGGRPLLFDGAMGTWFAAQPGRSSTPCELANVEHPEEIAAIHRAYLEAGCQAIKTNTFSVGSLFVQGEEDRATQLIHAACLLAQETAAPYGAFVFGDLGPVPHMDAISPEESYCRQADLFLAQGITCFLAETLATDQGIPALAQYLKRNAPNSFLLVSFAIGPDGITSEGLSGRELYHRTAALSDVDAVGFNCMSGPHHLLKFIQSLSRSDKPLSIMPNAGYPTVLGRRAVYQGTADYFAQQMGQIVNAGASIVGGCCGTTPGHIAALHEKLTRSSLSIQITVPARNSAPKTPPTEKNTLWNKLQAGKKVLAVELDPPADDHIQPFLEGVQILKDAGADAITVADSPVGRPRADSSLIACKLKRELGIEPLPHMACRDRNLIATKALLLGLSIEGIHNVLLVTGDPIPTADRDEVKSVFNFNSRKLARYVNTLNHTIFRTPFRVYGALNLNAKNFSIQLKLAKEKEENGVAAFLTQPILSQEALDNLKRARDTLKGKILAGVFPVVSHRNALFLNNEVSGVRVCDEVVRLYDGTDREQGEKLAERISAQVIRAAAPYADGIYLMTPFQRIELMRRIMESTRSLL